MGLRFLKWDGRLHTYTVVKPEMLEEQRARLGRRLRNLSGNSAASPSTDAPTPPSLAPPEPDEPQPHQSPSQDASSQTDLEEASKGE